MHSKTYLVFLATVAVATVTPGPGMLLGLAHGLRYGARRTLATACGNTAVIVLQAAAAMAGLAALAAASPNFVAALRLAGAVYLLYLGLRAWRSPASGLTVDAAAGGKTLAGLFLESAWVSATNPKAMLFFAAVMPPFLAEAEPGVTGCLAVITPMAVCSFVSVMLYAGFGAAIARFLADPAAARWMNRVVGGLFVTCGVYLMR